MESLDWMEQARNPGVRKAAILGLFISVVLVFSLPSRPSSSASAQNNSSHTQMALFGYWSEDNGFKSTVVLNNPSNIQVTVHPELYNLDGKLFAVGPIILEPRQQLTARNSAFRASSNFSSSSGPGGNGKTITAISDDDPGFGAWSVAHPTNSHTWASTQGGYDFREFIVGYSNSFPRYYVVFATGDWTLRVTGTNSGGTWSNNGSAITLQGSSSHPQSLTVTVTSGSPQSGDSAGLQPLGLSYATNHTFGYAP